MRVRRYFLSILTVFFASTVLFAQLQSTSAAKPALTVAKIMQNPLQSIGSLPGEEIYWSDDAKNVYFMWNPEHAESDSLYVVSRNGGTPRKLSPNERLALPAFGGDVNKAHTRKVYQKNGDIFLLNINTGKVRQLLNTLTNEGNPRFTLDEKGVTFIRDKNLFLLNLKDGNIRQITDFRSGKKPVEDETPKNASDQWLKRQERRLIEILRQRLAREELAKARRDQASPKRPLEIYLDKKRVEAQQLSPDQRFVTFRLVTPADDETVEVPNYITETGYTDMIKTRENVGSPHDQYEFGIYDIQRDTTYLANVADIPGIHDTFEFPQNTGAATPNVGENDILPKNSEKKSGETPAARNAKFFGPYWSDDGRHAMLVARAIDNKDRWILLLNPETGGLKTLDRQHDDAWIGGPGISGWAAYEPGNVGWMPDNRRVWFHSEESGYSHLYAVDVFSGKKTALTSGKFEVHDAKISRDKKHWHLTTNEEHPGERQFYRMALNGGKRTKTTALPGNFQAHLSPDEKMLAIRYSYSNKPWQLYLMPNKPGAQMQRITDNLSANFKAYPWRDPELTTFTARDGATVYARLYRPETVEKQGPAVIFVHGAGYLQNAHKWWSSYFREYMFHNLLVDHGYTVLDIDYRASEGYGRDWRTAIYRHMGGKDLDDQVDGAKFLAEKYDVDPGRIGIYGGSYGGFITFMALFTRPEVFACGAALRPVSDWAHYNHPYTSNILNEPQTDSLAYVRSSPIYFAEGLRKPLLICSGMVDTNVPFQDVVRLSQRLIELGKENWEVAFYPMESHGFKEPSSWTDEYRRIFKLFEENLK